MNEEDVVYPADDESFSEFKKLCEGKKGWVEYYHKNVYVATKHQENSSLKLIKACTSFSDCSAATLFDVVQDSEYRNTWDPDMIDMKEICKVCVNNTVCYYAVKCPPPLRPRDVVFLASWIAYPSMEEPQEYILMNKSVSHIDYPPRNNIVRAVAVVTGYLIKATGPSSCDFTYITHFDPRGSPPKWIINKVAQLITPKVIYRIHKAAKKYNAWKKAHHANLKPWLQPEQCRLPMCTPGQISTRVDHVEVIDEISLPEEKVFNNPDLVVASDDEIAQRN